MYKTLIAGVTALSVTVTPASARGLSDDQIGQILFGLFATAAIAKIIDGKSGQGANVQVQTPRPRAHQPRAHTPRAARMTLPARCVVEHRTRNGRVQLFGRRCIAHNYDFKIKFPRRCERDIRTSQGFRSGWEVDCMINAGYRTNRRR